MKTLKYIILAAAATLVFASCNKDPKLSGIEVPTEVIRINAGDRARVPAYPKPWNCTDYNFTYKVADESIVTVDTYGTITTRGLGTTTITASQGSYSATCTVEVYSYTIADLIQDKVADGLNGLWTFDKGSAMKATVGTDLEPHYPDTQAPRPGPVSSDGYTEVNGVNTFDGAILTKQYACFVLTHNLTSTSTYTFMIDAMRPSETSSGQWTTFFNSTLDNSADQWIYWRKDGILQFGSSSFRTGNDYFSDDKWFRMVLIKDNASKKMYAYANGVNIGDWSAEAWDAQVPEKQILLNADNDGDDKPLYFSTVAVWNRALSADDVATLGSL